MTGQEPVQLVAGHFLQKASESQIEQIKGHLNTHYFRHFTWPPYEYEWLDEAIDENGNKSRSTRPLPKEKYRYWVISFFGPNTQTARLQLAVNLLKKDLDLGSHFMFDKEGKGAGIIFGYPNVSSYFEDHLPIFETSGKSIFTVDSSNFSQVEQYFKSIEVAEKEQPQIYRSVKDFFQIKSLPRNSDLVVLGYFAILEALITHDPKKDFDSLNHQISTKMSLLSKRFERQLDYGLHFGESDNEKIWKKLYGYRSALAHGTPADFGTKFKMLKDSANVLNFVKEAVKLTLLFAMKETELLADLKKC